MDDTMHIYAFGDQTYDIDRDLSGLLQSQQDPLVRDFIERSTSLLRKEVGSLISEQRSNCPRFANLNDLLPHWRAGTLNPALSQGLTCICQIGTFLL